MNREPLSHIILYMSFSRISGWTRGRPRTGTSTGAWATAPWGDSATAARRVHTTNTSSNTLRELRCKRCRTGTKPIWRWGRGSCSCSQYYPEWDWNPSTQSSEVIVFPFHSMELPRKQKELICLNDIIDEARINVKTKRQFFVTPYSIRARVSRGVA